jgi:hypothetical protein
VAVGKNSEIYRSADSGDTWVDESGHGFGADELKAVGFSGSLVIAVGKNSAIYRIDTVVFANISIPFQSKWLLVLILVGYGVWAINKLKIGSSA